MKVDRTHGRRATAGDAHWGPTCPDCFMPKDPQALRCRACHMEQRTVSEANRRAARERASRQARDERGLFLRRAALS